uniref:FHF complex subunit HOOK interacting protein 1Aa n=1 Tax=Oryzias sinensis TaxID=183150 RepID=A0A8C8A0W7_9TELE
MASVVANGNQERQSLVLRGVDPETCMIVFKNHWAQVVKILEKHDPLRSSSTLPSLSVINLSHGSGGSSRFGAIPGDEASAVQNYVEHMLFLLMEEECGEAGAMGPILEFVVMENVMERLFVWSLRREFTDDMKLEQLKMYEMLVGQARQPLLHHKPILRPLMMLLSSCSTTTAPAVEAELVLLLNQLCCVLAKDPSILELFFHTSEDQGATNFLIFSLLIPFIHRKGTVGQQARDALLLIMSLSAENERVAKHIAENTYFCPVLATGLSGLYSSLPTKLEVPSEEWHCLHKEDWLQMPSLVQFLNSLEFCNAVIQVAHPSIRDQLLDYIYNGFLVPVLAPALHKLTLEEVMTTTAYLDLFLRSVSEPALLQTFLSFILLHQHEAVHILDTLVSRVNTPFQVPANCILDHDRIFTYEWLHAVQHFILFCRTNKLFCVKLIISAPCESGAAVLRASFHNSCFFFKYLLLLEKSQIFAEVDDGSGISCTIGSEIYLDVSYLHYLYDARLSISSCMRACRVWSAPYDGEEPPPDKYQPGVLEASSTNPVELEWDDSYDVCSVQTAEAPAESKPPPPLPAEPPKHIQEMRRTAIMLVKGSYIEENDFQDDVMVYDLVAKKDSTDLEGTKHLDKGKKGLETKFNGLTDCNANLQNAAAVEAREDFLDQYEELIRNLDTESGGKPATADGDRPVEEGTDEEEMDFTSFSAETPEQDKPQPPFGMVNKFRSGSTNKNPAVPFTGPFISVLLSRLENMLSNPLHVNLLLTGILAQLAAYPQPLLRSFLLNTNLVFQPTVRSLYQVLATVKNQIEEEAARRKDFTELITAAQHWLLAREASSITAAGRILKNSPPAKPKTISEEQTEVFATVLFTEFLKELAAIAQEHSILSCIPMEE